jgi:predicted Zn finger-like uncharacterized protein
MSDSNDLEYVFRDPPLAGGIGVDLADCLLHKLYIQNQDSNNQTAQFISRVLAEFLIIRREAIFKTDSEFLILYEMVMAFIADSPENLTVGLKFDFENLASIFQGLAYEKQHFEEQPDYEVIMDLNLQYIARELIQEIVCPSCRESFYKVRALITPNGLIRCPKCNQLTH